MSRLTVYTYEVRLVKSRCLHEKTLKVDAIVRVYLSNNRIRLVNSRYLYETPLNF